MLGAISTPRRSGSVASCRRPDGRSVPILPQRARPGKGKCHFQPRWKVSHSAIHPWVPPSFSLQPPLWPPLSPPSLHSLPLAEVCQWLVVTYKIQTPCGDLQELVLHDPLHPHSAPIFPFPFKGPKGPSDAPIPHLNSTRLSSSGL